MTPSLHTNDALMLESTTQWDMVHKIMGSKIHQSILTFLLVGRNQRVIELQVP